MRLVRRERSKGQSLVEFAFVFPIIAMLAFAFIDIGRAVFEWNTLTNSARQAVRVAAVNQLDPTSAPWNCDAHRPVESTVAPNWTFRGCALAAAKALGVTGSDVSVSYAAPPGTTIQCTSSLTVGCLVRVTVVNNYIPITPIAGSIIGPIAMSATSEMPIERLFP
jgi:Flp pilus assembly protein TadG